MNHVPNTSISGALLKSKILCLHQVIVSQPPRLFHVQYVPGIYILRFKSAISPQKLRDTCVPSISCAIETPPRAAKLTTLNSGSTCIISSEYDQRLRVFFEPLFLEFSAISEAHKSEPSIMGQKTIPIICLLYTSPSPRDGLLSRMPSSA